MELERKKAAIVRIVYGILVAAVSVAAVCCLWKLTFPFLLGFFIAWILRPVVGFVARHSGIGRKGVAIVAAAIFYGAAGLLCWLLGTLLYSRAEEWVTSLPQLYTQRLEPALRQLSQVAGGLLDRVAPGRAGGAFETVNTALQSAAASLSEELAHWAAGWLGKAPMAALTLVFTVLSSVMICIDYGQVTGFLVAQIPRRVHKLLWDLRDFLAGTLGKLLRAYAILTAVTFAELAVGLWILRVENALAVAACIALLDLLPVLGSGAVLIPWSAVAFVSDRVFLGGGLLVLWAVVSVFRQIMEPRIVGGQIGLHPLVTLAAMYAGMKLAGVGGLILAPVTCLVLRRLHEQGVVRLWRTSPE